MIKTREDFFQWWSGAKENFDDPATPVGQIFARYVSIVPRDEYEDVIVTVIGNNRIELILDNEFEIPITISTTGISMDHATGELFAFGITKVCSGLWTLTPSLNMPGLIHAFVNIYDVPEISPWERLIVVP